MLTMGRLTPERAGGNLMAAEEVPVASGATLFMGGIVALKGGLGPPGNTTAARLVRGNVGTGMRVVGILDNQPHLIPQSGRTFETDGIKARVKRGTFKVDILAGDPVTEADLYCQVYLHDDHTIRRSNPGNAYSIAGVLRGIDTSRDPSGAGAWVEFGTLPTSGLPLPTGVFAP